MNATCVTMPAPGLPGLNWVHVQGNSATKGAIFSLTLDGGAHAHDISTVLDKRGIAVRAGTHCAMPLMELHGGHRHLPRLVRALQHHRRG